MDFPLNPVYLYITELDETAISRETWVFPAVDEKWEFGKLTMTGIEKISSFFNLPRRSLFSVLFSGIINLKHYISTRFDSSIWANKGNWLMYQTMNDHTADDRKVSHANT